MIEDNARDLIKEIHEKLKELQAEDVQLAIGTLEKNQHGIPPFVYWLYGSIAADTTDRVGGANGAIATDVERFVVFIWHKTHEECRATRRNLIRALRLVACGPNVTVGDFEWVTEARPAWMTLGHQLSGAVTLRLPLPKAPEKFPVVLGEITGQGHTVFLNDEEVC